MIPLFEAVDGDLMGAGFKPSKGFSSLSSTVPSSPGVSMLVLGYGPTKPIQFAELETSRTSPFTWLSAGFAVLAHYWLICDALTRLPLPPEQCLQPCGPRSCHAQDIRLSTRAGPVCPCLSLHVHWAPSSHLTLVQSLSSSLCIIYIPMIWQMSWTQLKIQPRLEESTCRNNLACFRNSPLLGFHLWASSSSCFTHFVQCLLFCSFPATSVLTAENLPFQAVLFASPPSWLLISSVPENSIFFSPQSL